MFWEAWQDRRIDTAAGQAKKAAAKANDVAVDVRYLQDALNRLVLLNRAMWELLSEHTGVREEQLADKVREIDLRDGKLDGKLPVAVRDCPKCKRTLQRQHLVCLYCGEEDEAADPFRVV